MTETFKNPQYYIENYKNNQEEEMPEEKMP